MPGVQVENLSYALIIALLLSLLNTFVKPVLIFLTLPITLVTLGFFLLMINAGLILLAAYLVPKGFKVDGFWVAMLFSIVLSMTTSLIEKMAGDEVKDQRNR